MYWYSTEMSGGPDEVPYMKPYLGNTMDLLLLDGHRPYICMSCCVTSGTPS